MTTTKDKKKSKGGKLGGARFPRVNLKQALEYTKKLVSKTHTGSQPKNIIYPGVFGVTGPVGNERVSALRQYNLLKGDPKGFEATDLAKQICASPEAELTAFLEKACLAPNLYKKLFDIFVDDSVTTSKIRQQVININVHPDTADNCVSIFIDSLVFSKLAQSDGETINFSKIVQPQGFATDKDSDREQNVDSDEKADEIRKPPADLLIEHQQPREVTKSKAQIQINIDPSMDPEKLEKLLKVLKDYGQI